MALRGVKLKDVGLALLTYNTIDLSRQSLKRSLLLGEVVVLVISSLYSSLHMAKGPF